jgi:hypothetical protein
MDFGLQTTNEHVENNDRTSMQRGMRWKHSIFSLLVQNIKEFISWNGSVVYSALTVYFNPRSLKSSWRDKRGSMSLSATSGDNIKKNI